MLETDLPLLLLEMDLLLLMLETVMLMPLLEMEPLMPLLETEMRKRLRCQQYLLRGILRVRTTQPLLPSP